jgi:hypothetical protein
MIFLKNSGNNKINAAVSEVWNFPGGVLANARVAERRHIDHKPSIFSDFLHLHQLITIVCTLGVEISV